MPDTGSIRAWAGVTSHSRTMGACTDYGRSLGWSLQGGGVDLIKIIDHLYQAVMAECILGSCQPVCEIAFKLVSKDRFLDTQPSCTMISPAIFDLALIFGP